jgi:hypothetical protein
MVWSEREQAYWNEILDFERNLLQYEPNDFELTYEKWLEKGLTLVPAETRELFFEQFDQLFFHIHSLLQGSQFQMDARDRILTAARAFDDTVESISDLKRLSIDQLHYIAQQQSSRHRIYSLLQGAAVGIGGTLALSSDYLAMTIINLRAVQLISMSYGYEVNSPYEMMTSLKVYHTSTLPLRLRAAGWMKLKEEIGDEHYFYFGSENLTNETWLQGPLKQVLKTMLILTFKRKQFSGVPFISMAIGAGANYQLTRNVTNMSEKFYQMRLLMEKQAQT